MRLFLLLLLSFLIVSCTGKSNTEDKNSMDTTKQEVVVETNPVDSNQATSSNQQADNTEKVNGAKEEETIDSGKTISREDFEELKELMEPKVLTKEEEERLRVEDIDKNFYFKSNIIMDYYGLPLTIIRMPSDWSKAVKNNTVFVSKNANKNYLQGLPDVGDTNKSVEEDLSQALSSNNANNKAGIQSSENIVLSDQEKKNSEVLKKQKEIDHLLNNKKGDSINKIIDISLTTQHEGLLVNLVSKVTNADKILVLMFIKGSKMSEWDNSTDYIYRNIYIQKTVSFLYNNFKNIKIEKRYIDNMNMPKDEIFLVALNYVGSLDFNVYNAKPESISQWLIRYRDVELEKIKKDAEDKKQLEELISGTASAN